MLIDQSDRLRQELVAELEILESSAAWVEKGYTVARSIRSLWPILAGVAGLVVAKKGGSWLRKLGKAWSFFRIARNVLGLRPRRKRAA